jgi:hypothetical protein
MPRPTQKCDDDGPPDLPPERALSRSSAKNESNKRTIDVLPKPDKLISYRQPPAFLWLLGEYPGAGIIYLDPDILLTGPLIHVLRALETGSGLGLTPHITARLQDGCLLAVCPTIWQS